jgi:C-terminal processing protease CtpA/Prc
MTRAALLAVFLCAGVAAAAPSRKAYKKDVIYALDQIEKECKLLLRSKKIDWGKVRARFIKEVKKVRSEQDQYLLLCRMIAALQDGHAYVQAPEEIYKAVEWPVNLEGGPGLFFCRIGKGIFVKSAWSGAGASGVTPGMEVLKIDKEPAAKWMEQRVAEVSRYHSFSTDQQAFFWTCHWGLGGPKGSTLGLQLRSVDRFTKKVTVTRGKASTVPYGPAFFPEGVKRVGRQSYAILPSGYGYIHLRDTKDQIPGQMDQMLAAIGNVKGLILDFRANGGGSFNHDELLGRFVPKGKQLDRSKAYSLPSKGPNPYGGPIVVIVDAGVRSAGETGSGMFKEDGRAYVIGESATAGMSSSKTMILLPSGRFKLRVSVRSNKSRFQGGRGIEGLGIQPHEIVEYKPKDLAGKVDTLIVRAEALLKDFPQNKVAYRPGQHGWKPPR